MTNHERFEQDPDTELRELVARAEFLAARGVVSSRLTHYQAANAAAIARKYPTMNPGIAGPIMIQGIPYDSPTIGELAMMDQRQIDDDGWLVAGLKTGVRWTAIAAEIGVKGYQQMGNTVVGMMQGRSFEDARRAAGSNILGEALQQRAMNPDRPMNLGNGWLPESQLPWETDGFTDRFRDNLDGDFQKMEESFRQTVNEALEEYGAPITQRSHRELFSTTIRRTVNGKTYVSNYSPINAAMNPIVGLQNPMTGNVILEPDDAVYQTVSKWGQLGFDVIVDPLNIPLITLPRMAQARRFLPIQMSADDAFRAGANAKRHWYNPGAGADWLVKDKRGIALSEYLAHNESFSETMRVLDLGDAEEAGHVYEAITKAKTVGAVQEALMPYLGTVITDVPVAHLGPSAARPIQSMRTALSRSYRGPGGYTTRIDSTISKPWVRWGAKMTHGVLDGNDLAHTLHVVNNYMRTFNVPVEKIDGVMSTLVQNSDVSFTMGKAGRLVEKEIGEVLKNVHGAHPDDLKAVFTKYDETNDAIKAYHMQNIGYPVRGPGTRMKTGADKVTPTETTRPLTTDELAPGGTMTTQELLGARLKAGAGSDRKIRAGVGGLKEQTLAAGSYKITQGQRTWAINKVGKEWELTGTGLKGGTQTFKTKKAAKAAIVELGDTEVRALGELGSSVAETGITEPVQVAFHPKSGQYRVVDGNKRVLAAEAAGLETIPVEITEVGRRFVGIKDEAVALRRNTLSSKGQVAEITQVRTPGDPIPAVDPMLEAEFMGDIYILPDQRDLRRMTSRLRKIRRGIGKVDPDRVMAVGEKAWGGKIPMHYQSALGQFIDIGMARWREWQLIAVRWAFNVIPDELFRLSASGFASPAYHPGQYLMYAFGSKGDIALTGDRFSDILVASELGAGYAQNLTEVAQRGFVGDVRRVPWIPIQEGQQGYFDAWGTQIIHMWADKFTRKAMSMTREEAFVYFRTDPAGIAIVDDILKGARADTRLSKLSRDDILRDHIAQVDARAHQMAGGTWRAFDVDPQNPGKWTDSNGNVWDSPPPKWVKGDDVWVITQKGDEDLLSIMATGRVKTGGTFVSGGKRLTLDDLSDSDEFFFHKTTAGAVEGIEAEGLRSGGFTSVLRDTPSGFSVEQPTFVFRKSEFPKSVRDETSISGIADFRKARPGTIDAMGDLTIPKPIAVIENGKVRMLRGKGDKTQPATKPILWSERGPAGDIFATESKSRRQGMQQVERLRDQLKTARARWKKLEEGGTVAPAAPKWVRGQDPRLAKRLDNAYKMFVDQAFAILGQAPTMLLARAPHFKQVYWREMARGYVNSTPELRTIIKSRAKEAGMEIELSKWVKEELKLAGYKNLPTMPKGSGWTHEGNGINDLNDWGKAVALDDTKSLLYDLSESHNIVDMTRNVFVFAEAWWEILSRWSNMLFNPKTRSLYNWEKARQVGEFAQQEGWMSENEFGQTVFNYPSVGLTILGQQARGQTPERLATEISTQQLISNPLAQLGGGEQGALRSVMGPGFGPITQILAAPLMSVLPNSWQQMFQYTVTGEFPLADSMLEQGFHSLPSSFKNALTLVNAEIGMTERRFNTNVATSLEMLAMSGDYDPADSDAMLALEKDALSLGATLSLARLVDSLFGPESPRYVPQLLEDSIRFDQHQYVDAAAIGAAIEYATELFRDPLAASAYVADQYGLDPLDLEGVDLPKSRVIKQRPVTFEAFTVARDNPEFYDKYQFIAFAFAPDNPEDDFFLRAWYDQLSNDTTVSLTTEQQVAVFSNRQASLKFQWSQRYAEQEMIRQVKQNPHRQKGIEQDWRDWLQARTLDIQAEHTGWSRSVFDINAHYTPGPATPEWGDLYADFQKMVVRDSDGTITGIDPDVVAMNPVTAEFVRGFMTGIDQAGADSLARGNSEISWLASTAKWATDWQNMIANDSRTYVNEVRLQGGVTTGVEWIIRRWLNPLLKGTDMNTPFITDSGVGIVPVYRADDRISTE